MTSMMINPTGSEFRGIPVRKANPDFGLLEPPHKKCKPPPSPIGNINAANPSSWMSTITGFSSALLGGVVCIEDELARGLTGDSDIDPVALRGIKFAEIAQLRHNYDLEKWINDLAKANEEAEKDQFDFFKPAR